MAAKKIDDKDDKVMDVSAPGKGKIITNSRPVVAPVASEGEQEGVPIEEIKSVQAPSATRRVIQPIVHDDLPDEDGNQPDNSVKVVINSTEEKEAKPVNEKTTEDESNSTVNETVAGENKPQIPEDTDQPETEKPAEAPKAAQEPEPKKEEAKPEPAKSSPAESSDSANVDELVNTVETKKEAVKKAEESAKKDEALQALIDSKQYFVPVGHEGPMTAKARKQGSNFMLVFIIMLLALLVGGYLAIDAGLVDIGVDVPFELIKN
jgi:hypothetical protein